MDPPGAGPSSKARVPSVLLVPMGCVLTAEHWRRAGAQISGALAWSQSATSARAGGDKQKVPMDL